MFISDSKEIRLPPEMLPASNVQILRRCSSTFHHSTFSPSVRTLLITSPDWQQRLQLLGRTAHSYSFARLLALLDLD